MKQNLPLATRLTLYFMFFALAIIAGVGWLSYVSGRDSLRTAIVSELQATSIEKQAALNAWVEDRHAVVKTLATSLSVREALAAYVTAAPGSAEAQWAHARLAAELQVYTVQRQFLALLVIEPNEGQVIAATDIAEEGKFREDQPYFINGKNGPFVQNLYYSLALQAPAMTVSAPILDANGGLLGVLAGRLNLEEMNAIINRRSGLRQSDEALLVNTSNLFATQPRLALDTAVLQRGIHTEAVNRCLEHNTGVISAPDYRGVPALVAYRWLPERGLCLIVKIDEAETLAPVHAFGRTIMLVGGLIMISAFLLAIGLARTITQPVLTLKEGATRIGRGELNLRLPETGGGELGHLAREFNHMAEALLQKESQLRDYTANLEHKVKDSTKAVSEQAALLDLAQDAILVFDLNRTITYWNHGAEVTYGWSKAEAVGQMVHDLLHTVFPESRKTVDQALQTNGQWAGELVHTRRHGSQIVVASRLVVQHDEQGQPIRILEINRDITERKQVEQQLKKQTEELIRSNKELEQFAHIASHDLQEPLRVVSNYVQLLARRYQNKLDKDADEFIGYAVEGVAQMKNLITDLLAFSRVETRGQPFSLVSLEDSLQRALNNLQVSIEESGAVITHDKLPQVSADATQMVQLFQNLIGNAIKFRSKAAPRILIGVRRDNDHWLIFVNDNGIGVDPQFSERIFLIFQRLHARDEYPGTGIGLALCRRIVERHGGQIWVESSPGQDSTFYFTLPLKSSAEIVSPEDAKRDKFLERTRDIL